MATASPNHSGAPALILFDGVCNLCDAAVQWIIARDKRGVFRFASLQSDAAQSALRAQGALDENRDSIVLIDERGVHTHSDAVIEIARRLGFPWSLAIAARVLPRPIRDGVYAWIAAHRYRWFGRRNACMIPTPALRQRFLSDDEKVDERLAALGSGGLGSPERPSEPSRNP